MRLAERPFFSHFNEERTQNEWGLLYPSLESPQKLGFSRTNRTHSYLASMLKNNAELWFIVNTEVQTFVLKIISPSA